VSKNSPILLNITPNDINLAIKASGLGGEIINQHAIDNWSKYNLIKNNGGTECLFSNPEKQGAWKCGYGDNPFYFNAVGDSVYNIINTQGRCIDTKVGSDVINSATCNNTLFQQWELIYV